MYVESLWIENFRSIRSLKLDGLGPFNVFYGENGAGKSNILAAIETIFRGLARWRPGDTKVDLGLGEHDLNGAAPVFEDVCIGAVLVAKRQKSRAGGRYPSEVAVEFRGGPFPVFPYLATKLDVRITGRTVSLLDQRPEDPTLGRTYDFALRSLSTVAQQFRLVPASRALSTELAEPPGESTDPADRIGDLLARGRLKHALVEAMTSPDLAIRTGLGNMRDMLRGEPLRRPAFDPVYNPRSQAYELTEVTRASDGAFASLPLDLAGLGIQQVYSVLAGVLLTGASIAAVEEPESHLHPRTTGRHLRTLLRRCVEEGHIDQLFVATHSNLFDLDPEGFFLVRHDPEAGTVVERSKDFTRLDREVFWEPGPARAALLGTLRDLPADTVVFRRPSGEPVTAEAMLALLQADDLDAQAFVDDVQALAVGTVRRLANRPRGKG